HRRRDNPSALYRRPPDQPPRHRGLECRGDVLSEDGDSFPRHAAPGGRLDDQSQRGARESTLRRVLRARTCGDPFESLTEVLQELRLLNDFGDPETTYLCNLAGCC